MASESIEHAPIEWIKIDHLFCDESYQRPLDQRRAERIAAEFDPDAFGTLTVSKRADNRYMTIDGRHRAEALRVLGWDGQRVPCRVFRGLSQSKEAKLFATCNNYRALRFIDRFMSRLTEKEPVAIAIAKIASDAGYRVERKGRDGTITAARALENVYIGKGQRISGINPTALKSTLLVLTEAWGRTTASVNGLVIEGVGLFFLRYGDAPDRARVVRKLAGTVTGPSGLMVRGKGKREMHGGSIVQGVAHYLTEEYNRGLRGKKRLCGWREGDESVA